MKIELRFNATLVQLKVRYLPIMAATVKVSMPHWFN